MENQSWKEKLEQVRPWQNRTSSRTSKTKGTTRVDEIEALKEEFKEEAEKSEEVKSLSREKT